MRQLGGKTFRDMIVVILKNFISNYLSTLYCWNGKGTKKEAFKDLLLAKCIKSKLTFKLVFYLKINKIIV